MLLLCHLLFLLRLLRRWHMRLHVVFLLFPFCFSRCCQLLFVCLWSCVVACCCQRVVSQNGCLCISRPVEKWCLHRPRSPLTELALSESWWLAPRRRPDGSCAAPPSAHMLPQHRLYAAHLGSADSYYLLGSAVRAILRTHFMANLSQAPRAEAGEHALSTRKYSWRTSAVAGIL